MVAVALGIREDEHVSDLPDHVLHTRKHHLLDRGSLDVNDRIHAREVQHFIPIVQNADELKQDADGVVVSLILKALLGVDELAIPVVVLGGRERCRTSREEEVGVDGHSEEANLACNIDERLQVQRLRSNARISLLSEPDIKDVVVNQALADKRVEKLQPTVEGNGSCANSTGREDHLGLADVEVFDDLVLRVPNLETVDAPAARFGAIDVSRSVLRREKGR